MIDFRRTFVQLFVVVLIMSAGSFEAIAQGDDAKVLYQRALAATCANCHGTEGKGVENGGMPLIHQLSQTNMLAQLMAFKSGARSGTIMPQLAKGYTDEQLEVIARVLGQK
jgi:sulfide dehydrogenase cytochrome subunit